eukprot:gene8321-1485_t
MTFPIPPEQMAVNADPSRFFEGDFNTAKYVGYPDGVISEEMEIDLTKLEQHLTIHLPGKAFQFHHLPQAGWKRFMPEFYVDSDHHMIDTRRQERANTLPSECIYVKILGHMASGSFLDKVPLQMRPRMARLWWYLIRPQLVCQSAEDTESGRDMIDLCPSLLHELESMGRRPLITRYRRDWSAMLKTCYGGSINVPRKPVGLNPKSTEWRVVWPMSNFIFSNFGCHPSSFDPSHTQAEEVSGLLGDLYAATKDDLDLKQVWDFCSLVYVGGVVYTSTQNSAGGYWITANQLSGYHPSPRFSGQMALTLDQPCFLPAAVDPFFDTTSFTTMALFDGARFGIHGIQRCLCLDGDSTTVHCYLLPPFGGFIYASPDPTKDMLITVGFGTTRFREEPGRHARAPVRECVFCRENPGTQSQVHRKDATQRTPGSSTEIIGHAFLCDECAGSRQVQRATACFICRGKLATERPIRSLADSDWIAVGAV